MYGRKVSITVTFLITRWERRKERRGGEGRCQGVRTRGGGVAVVQSDGKSGTVSWGASER